MSAQELLGQLKEWALEQGKPIDRVDLRNKLDNLSGEDGFAWSDARNALEAADLERWMSAWSPRYLRPCGSVAALIDLAIAVCAYRSRLREEWVAAEKQVPF